MIYDVRGDDTTPVNKFPDTRTSFCRISDAETRQI